MMRERLLAKARELIADRLEQAQVRRGDGVVVRNLGDRNTISIEPELLGSPDTLAGRRYYAGELVVVGNSVRVAPFVVQTYDPCDPSTFVDGAQPVFEYDLGFPFLVPTISGTRLDAVSPPTLSIASSGMAYIKATYTWGQTPGVGEIGSESVSPSLHYYLDSVEIVAYPLGTEPPYSIQTGYLDTSTPETPTFVISHESTTVHQSIGWWEDGRRPMQYDLPKTFVNFSVSLESSTTSVNLTRDIAAPPPLAYINYGILA